MTVIVLAEPSAVVREALTLVLEEEGYVVHAVADRAALAAQLARARPDLLVLDAGLPGDDVAGYLALSGDPVPAIVLAAGAAAHAATLRATPGTVVDKYEIETLLRTIARLLRRQAA